jgi:hypothetical protein
MARVQSLQLHIVLRLMHGPLPPPPHMPYVGVFN